MQALCSQRASGDGAVVFKLARDFIGGSRKFAQHHTNALFLPVVAASLGIEQQEREDGVH